jgi:ferric-dicitrate binding protein FerR (iron transport regulator)
MNSTALMDRGIRCLNNELGLLDAERFVALLIREPFDYTQWRRDNLFKDMSLDEIIDEADRYSKAHPNE